MKKHITRMVREYPVDFISLMFILIIGAVYFYTSQPNLFIQKQIVVFIGIAYFLWGVFHHWHQEDLCLKIASEYFLIAFLGVLAVLFVLMRV